LQHSTSQFFEVLPGPFGEALIRPAWYWTKSSFDEAAKNGQGLMLHALLQAFLPTFLQTFLKTFLQTFLQALLELTAEDFMFQNVIQYRHLSCLPFYNRSQMP